MHHNAYGHTPPSSSSCNFLRVATHIDKNGIILPKLWRKLVTHAHTLFMKAASLKKGCSAHFKESLQKCVKHGVGTNHNRSNYNFFAALGFQGHRVVAE